MKSILKKMRRIDVKWSIFFIIILICANFILFMVNQTLLSKSEETIKQVTDLRSKFEGVWDNVESCDVGIRGYMLIPTEQMFSPFVNSYNNYQKSYQEAIYILVDQGFDISLLDDYKKMLDYKMEEGMTMKKLVDEGKLDEAVEILRKDTGAELWKVYAKALAEINDFENNILANAQAIHQKSQKNAFYWQITLMLISLPFLFSIFHRLSKNKKQRKELFQQLQNSNKQYLFTEAESNNNQNMDDKRIIQKIVENLKKATEFIQDIANGNYQVSWKGMDESNRHLNQNNLAGELIKMRDQMKKVREEDIKRSWANEGMAKFSDMLTRRDEKIENVLSSFISELIKYLKATQGAIFILNEMNNEPALDLKACYAYGRQKFIKKTVLPGEGLVGQSFLEKDTIYLTDVPNSYIKITSGLGQSLPKNVLIVPMLYNDQVIGVTELASFEVLKEHEVQFVKKIMENLSAYLVSVNMNEKTKMLLEESQYQSSMLKSQEEELRQNSEELHAQQESLNRENELLKKRIIELEKGLNLPHEF